MNLRKWWIILFSCYIPIGCSGSGDGLDEFGNPLGTTGSNMQLAFSPTFKNIQKEIFEKYCLDCHSGAFAALGLRLDSNDPYILRRHSIQIPALLLVEPGNPDNSYLIHKLEGEPYLVGAQMPLNRPVLPQSMINSIRAWIADGAS